LTNAIQWSNRSGDAILVIGGQTADEFTANAVNLLGQVGEELVESLPAFVPDGTAAAVATVQTSMPGSAEIFGFRGQPAQGQRGSQGYVTDKWGAYWHPTKFDEAPACQCQGSRNQGKLALKIGTARATKKEFTGWFCANTFEAKSGDGCEAMFNNSYPNL